MGLSRLSPAASSPGASAIGFRNSYLVAEDGQRFLITLSLEEASNIEVVVNWPATLKPR
jgi:hypothetical protein